MRRRRTWPAFVAIASAIGTAGTAQFGRTDSEAVWKLLVRYDRNGDGKVSAAEYPRGAEKFAALDRDSDGFLTRDDLDRPGRRGRRRAPRREDPAVTVARGADRDADGAVSADEWRAFVARVVVQGRVDRARVGEALGHRMRARLALRGLDADRDGHVTAQELATAFARIDRDRDGALSRSELPARRTARRGGRREGRLPKRGDVAPDFTLPLTKASRAASRGAKSVTLSSFAGKRPVALIFGSYT